MSHPFETPLSHPPDKDSSGRELTDHLGDVAYRCKLVTPDSTRTPDDNNFKRFVACLGALHDFGKLTTWFQQYIAGETPPQNTDHSKVGGVVAYHVLREIGYSRRMALTGFTVIARHHSGLTNPPGYAVHQYIRDDEAQSMVESKIANIDQYSRSVADDIITTASNGETDWESVRSRVMSGEIADEMATVADGGLRGVDKSGLDRDVYSVMLRAWSTLLVADRTSAAGIPESAFTATYQSSESLESHITDSVLSESPSELDQLREDARQSVLDSIPGFVESDTRIGSIALPTGIGKTFTGLNAALRLRERLAEDSDGVPGRVVYALPFTSIIDQTAKTMRDVFEVDDTSDELTIHHHLSETRTEIESDKVGSEAEYLVAESWRSGIVTTTFVQLFESLAAPTRKQSMKVPALSNSVVILDEPQALPVQWWPLVCELLRVLTEDFGAYVLLMTATQPSILSCDPDDELEQYELVQDKNQYYEPLERVEFELHESTQRYLEDPRSTPLGHGDAATNLAHSIDDGDSVLAICNTVASARTLHDETRTRTTQDWVSISEVYETVLDEHGNTLPETNTEGSEKHTESDIQKYVAEVSQRVENQATLGESVVGAHLTTRIRPRDRQILLGTITHLQEKTEIPIVLTATQVVEAGVDISFEHVYRDFAPLDSIVQAAGRCNRNNEQDTGTVTIWWLGAPEEEDGYQPSRVYLGDENFLYMTRDVFRNLGDGQTQFSESTVTIDGVEQYYETVSDAKPGDNSWVTDELRGGDYESLGQRSLIGQDENGADVIVPRTHQESEQVETAVDAVSNDEYETATAVLSNLGEIQVSVPVPNNSEPRDVLPVQTTIEVGGVETLVLDATKSSSLFDAVFGVQRQT